MLITLTEEEIWIARIRNYRAWCWYNEYKIGLEYFKKGSPYENGARKN